MAALWAAVHGPLTIVATLKAVGIILSISLLIAPQGHCGTPDTTLSYCAPTGDWHIGNSVNDWCLVVLFYRQRTSSDDCRLIRGFVHHDVCRYQHQRTQKGKLPYTGSVITQLAQHPRTATPDTFSWLPATGFLPPLHIQLTFFTHD